MMVAYLRVSTEDQNLDRQRVMMDEQGIEKQFEEKLSGKDTKRPELQKMLDFVREGDSIVVESISRLARSTHDLLNIVERLKEKGVGLVSKKEAIDTTTPQGKFILTIFGALAELERESILQRQKEGIAAAKGKGKHMGRPKFVKPENWDEVVGKWKVGEIQAVEAIKRMGIPKSSFYKNL